MNLTGTYEHQLDGKNRIRIPKKLREKLPAKEKLYFVKYTGGCIAVYPESILEERMQGLNSIRSNEPEKLRAKRTLMRAIVEAEEDDQHRTMLSAAMREHAGITKDVISIGMGDYIEIWAAERINNVPDDSEERVDMPLEDAFLQVGI